jgi:hypothetical protein
MKACVKQWLGEQMPGVDEALLASIYGEYAETAKRLVAEIAAVDKTVHKLKGDASLVGDRPMAEASIAIRERISEMKRMLNEL